VIENEKEREKKKKKKVTVKGEERAEEVKGKRMKYFKNKKNENRDNNGRRPSPIIPMNVFLWSVDSSLPGVCVRWVFPVFCGMSCLPVLPLGKLYNHTLDYTAV
jgi:hypothetical protein